MRSRASRYRSSQRPNHGGSSEDGPRGPIISFRQHPDGMTGARIRPSHVLFEDEEDDSDQRTLQMPPEFNASQPDLNVVTECSGDEEEPLAPGGFPLYRRAVPPNRIGILPFEDEDDDDNDDNDNGNDDNDSDDNVDNLTLRSLGSEDGFHRLRRVPANRGVAPPFATDAAVATGSNSISLHEARDAHARATQDAVRAVGGSSGGELLAPHARFFIEKKKSRCTIRFDPPISGRFILLKMWSSRLDPTGNIDIQSVIARGYHGPRYFPNVEVR